MVEMHLELPVPAQKVCTFLDESLTWHPLVKDAYHYDRKRSYTLVNGEELVHEFMPMPEGLMGYRYRLVGTSPLRNYEAMIRLDDIEGGCLVTWRSTFEVNGISVEEAVQLVKLVYQTGFDTLLKHFSKPDTIALTAPKKVKS